MGDAIALLVVCIFLFIFGFLLGGNVGKEHVEAGVGRTFECRKVDAVEVDGIHLKGKGCKAVEK